MSARKCTNKGRNILKCVTCESTTTERGGRSCKTTVYMIEPFISRKSDALEGGHSNLKPCDQPVLHII